jgi:aryl-alcohol dehydrogenase-like predicted oxidoreductase
LQRAPELGVDLLDSWDAYGQARNEALIARALAGRRQRYVLASKFGNLRNRDGRRPRTAVSPVRGGQAALS